MDFLGLLNEYTDSQGATVRVREPAGVKLKPVDKASSKFSVKEAEPEQLKLNLEDFVAVKAEEPLKEEKEAPVKAEPVKEAPVIEEFKPEPEPVKEEPKPGPVKAAEKPVEKPVEKSVEKPAEKPAPESLSAHQFILSIAPREMNSCSFDDLPCRSSRRSNETKVYPSSSKLSEYTPSKGRPS